MRNALADNCARTVPPRRIAVLATASMLAVFGTSLPSTARACSCMQVTPQQAVDHATAVFEGYVVEVAPSVLADGVPTQRTARMKLVRTWKGVSATAEEIEVNTPGDSAMCGFGFEAGRSYLVYASEPSGTPPRLEVSLCSRTRLIDLAEEDLKQLGMGSTPVDPKAETPVPESPAKTQGAPGAQPPARGGCAGCHALGAAGGRTTLGPLLLLSSLLLLICRRRSASRS